MFSSDPILLGCLLTVFLPLTAFALIMIFTRDNHKLSLAISLVASTIPLIIAWTFFFKLGGRAPSSTTSTGWSPTSSRCPSASFWTPPVW